MTTVEGTIDASLVSSTLEPDGKRSHWLKVNGKLREAAGVDVGDIVTLEIAPAEKAPEPRVPADRRRALAAASKARTVWTAITPAARRDCDPVITSASSQRLAARRIVNACDMLAAGKLDASAASIGPGCYGIALQPVRRLTLVAGP